MEDKYKYFNLAQEYFLTSLEAGQRFDKSRDEAQRNEDLGRFKTKDHKELMRQFWDNQVLSLADYYHLEYVQNVNVFYLDRAMRFDGVEASDNQFFYQSAFASIMLKKDNQNYVSDQVMKRCDSLQDRYYEQCGDEVYLMISHLKSFGISQALMELKKPDLTQMLSDKGKMDILAIEPKTYQRLNLSS